MKTPMKPTTVIIWISLIICSVVAIITFFLPYASVDQETRKRIEVYPDEMYMAEINMTYEDAADISVLEMFRIYSYAKENTTGDYQTISSICIALIEASAILTLLVFVFSAFRQTIPILVFSPLNIGVFYLLAWDLHDRGVINDTYSFWDFNYAYYLTYVLHALLFVGSIVFLILRSQEKKVAKRKQNESYHFAQVTNYPFPYYQPQQNLSNVYPQSSFQPNYSQPPFPQQQNYYNDSNQQPFYTASGLQPNNMQAPQQQLQNSSIVYPYSNYSAPSPQNPYSQQFSPQQAHNSQIVHPKPLQQINLSTQQSEKPEDGVDKV